jgi:hypothetical protein
MENSSEKSSADIQREIDDDRKKIEARIGAIQERMSPGQLVDEVLAHANGSGGGEYVSNLGKALKDNPLPVALMGVSLTWLIAKQGTPSPGKVTPTYDEEYPLYSAQGAVRRVGPPEEIGGVRYSHFADEAGQRFKALTDETGRRAGNFIDASGKTYRGFSDAAGKKISQISDEAGAIFEASTGWASDTWKQVKDTASGLAQKVSDSTGSVSTSASTVGTSLQDQTARLNEVILKQFRDQPLVGGALAFAVGAAIGAALPHTDKEDEVFGETADAVKANVADHASEFVNQGTEIASDAYDKAVSVASDVHDAAKERIADEVNEFKDRNSRS